MIQKYLILGNQRIQHKLYAYWIKVKLPNLAFLALHGPAITYLLKSYFLLLPFYLPFPSACLHACTSTRHRSQFLILSSVLLFTAVLLQNQQVQIPLFVQRLPRWQLPGLPRECSSLPLAPRALADLLQKLHSVPFQQSFSLQGASLVAQLVKKIRLQCGRPGFDPSVGRIPRRRERLPTPVSWPGEFQGPYSPKSQTRLSDFHWVYSINTKLCVYPHNVALTFRRDTHTMLCVQRSPARASRTRQTLPPTYGSYLPCYTP